MFKFNQILFYLSIFLLPSAGIISGILLIFLIFNSFFIQSDNFFKDKWNIPFIIVSGLLILSCIIHNNNDFYSNKYFDISLSWIGLFNWIPLFLIFWAIQPYIQTKKQRLGFAYSLIAGTFPVLISGFGQYWFNWTGPLELFNGLIIWFQRPIQGNGGLTGLFNASNYAGSWLNIVWPFCLALLIQNRTFFIKKIISLITSISFVIAIVLTNSRNAWLALILAIPLFLGISSFIWLIPILFFISFLIAISVLNIFPTNLQIFVRSIIPDGIWKEFVFSEFSGREGRLEIWLNSIKFVNEKPFFGWGPGSFQELYEKNNNVWLGHAHNLPLDFAFNYGYLVSIILFATIIFLHYRVLTKTYILEKLSKSITNKSLIDRAWWISSLIFSITQLLDVQYYDGRLSIIYWILLAGLRAKLNTN